MDAGLMVWLTIVVLIAVWFVWATVRYFVRYRTPEILAYKRQQLTIEKADRNVAKRTGHYSNGDPYHSWFARKAAWCVGWAVFLAVSVAIRAAVVYLRR